MKEFMLKQQTPMIHFQVRFMVDSVPGNNGRPPRNVTRPTPEYYDSGTTLRATEVKPKLDYFIFQCLSHKQGKRLSSEDIEKIRSQHPAWFFIRKNKDAAAKKNHALDYQLRFSVDGKGTAEDCKSPLFFANNTVKPGNTRVGTIFSDSTIKMRLLCFHPELEQFIAERLPLFFMVTNFGARQDKGFGSFKLLDASCKPLLPRAQMEQQIVEWFAPSVVYKLDYPESPHNDSILNDVNIFYRVLKSGINDVKFDKRTGETEHIAYIKSYLTRFFLSFSIGSEKRRLKETKVVDVPKPTHPKTLEKDKEPNQLDDYWFIRGLLGVSEVQNWVKSHSEIKIQARNDQFARMPSPLLFMVSDHTLYFVLQEPYNRAGGDVFYSFTNKRDSRRTVDIALPSKKTLREKNIDLAVMMRGFVEELNGKGNYHTRELLQKLGKGKQKPEIFNSDPNWQIVPLKGGAD